jgi:hypothetical protein
MKSSADITVDTGFDALDYGYARSPLMPGSAYTFGERDLWCAVIAQAFIDMGAVVPPTSGRVPGFPRRRGSRFYAAVRWLLRDREDFVRICDLAGVSPDVIRHAARIFYGRCQLDLCLEEEAAADL